MGIFLDDSTLVRAENRLAGRCFFMSQNSDTDYIAGFQLPPILRRARDAETHTDDEYLKMLLAERPYLKPENIGRIFFHVTG